MSTVRAINFQHPSASAANITLAADGTVSGGIPSPNRNLLYNGAMQVSQRGTSTASISGVNTVYVPDRYGFNVGNQGTWTYSVENDAPTGSGFRKSAKLLCTTADASPAAGDYIGVYQALEGQDLQRVLKGTAAAQPLTLSFWVKSNVTGTYIAELYDGDNTRQVSAAYTISASATWEKKTITFPADTTGAFDNDNAASMSLVLHIGAGSNLTSGTLNTTWAAVTNANRAVGQTNLAAAINNYWQITGVQLETGSVATPFEFKSFGQELRECQRYFQLINSATGKANSTTAVQFALQFMTEMRTDVSAITSTTARITDVTVSDFTTSNAAAVIQNAGSRGARVIINNFSGLTAGSTYLLLPSGANSAPLQLSAEL